MTNCTKNNGLCSVLCFDSNEDSISKELYQPPKNPLYSITPNSSNEKSAQVSFVHSHYQALSLIQYRWIKEFCYLRKKENSNSIVILYLKNNNKRTTNSCTIVFSHGNKTSLGIVYSFLYDLATQLNCNVISYDYSGYGLSNGSPSEEEIRSDITEIALFIQEQKIPFEEVMLLGHSIGSVPSIYFSSLHQNILGMILISPLALGFLFLNQINPGKRMDIHKKNSDSEDEYFVEDYEYGYDDNDEDKMHECDENNGNNVKTTKKKSMCNNSNKLSKIISPLFLVHGMLDDVIPYTHSRDLAKRVAEVSQWFPKKGTHTNIIDKYRDKFYSKIKEFGFYCHKVRVMKMKEPLKSTMHDSNISNSKEKYIKDIITFHSGDSYEYTDNFDSSQIGDSNSIDFVSNKNL